MIATKNLKTIKTILGDDYNKMCQDMMLAAERNQLPIGFQLEDVENISCDDIGKLCYKFEADTNLTLYANVYPCPDCGRTHVYFEVDYPDERSLQNKKYIQ